MISSMSFSFRVAIDRWIRSDRCRDFRGETGQSGRVGTNGGSGKEGRRRAGGRAARRLSPRAVGRIFREGISRNQSRVHAPGRRQVCAPPEIRARRGAISLGPSQGGTTSAITLMDEGYLAPIAPVLTLAEVRELKYWWLGKHHYADDAGKYIFAFQAARGSSPTRTSSTRKRSNLTGTCCNPNGAARSA